jgi:hypothetical protein
VGGEANETGKRSGFRRCLRAPGNALNVDWSEQAAKKAADYLDFTSFSRSGLIEQLLFGALPRRRRSTASAPQVSSDVHHAREAPPRLGATVVTPAGGA